ncbi:MAG: response regulator [Kofleriaceae bacterium]
MQLAPVSESPRSRTEGPRLAVDCDSQAELAHECRAILRRGQIVVATNRSLDEGSAVRLQFTAPGLLVPLAVATSVAAGAAGGGGEVTLELDPAEQERVAAILERLLAGDRTLVAPVVRVLIADDNPHLAELIRAGLGSTRRRGDGDPPALHFEFVVAADGQAAVAALDAARFDVALIGVYLPPLPGGRVIAHARARGAQSVAVIGLASDDSAEAAAFAAGADAFMAKPVRLRTIHDAIVALAPAVRAGGAHRA